MGVGRQKKARGGAREHSLLPHGLLFAGTAPRKAAREKLTEQALSSRGLASHLAGAS